MNRDVKNQRPNVPLLILSLAPRAHYKKVKKKEIIMNVCEKLKQ
jgi:hypothetical protein